MENNIVLFVNWKITLCLCKLKEPEYLPLPQSSTFVYSNMRSIRFVCIKTACANTQLISTRRFFVVKCVKILNIRQG